MDLKLKLLLPLTFLVSSPFLVDWMQQPTTLINFPIAKEFLTTCAIIATIFSVFFMLNNALLKHERTAVATSEWIVVGLMCAVLMSDPWTKWATTFENKIAYPLMLAVAEPWIPALESMV